MSDDADGMRAQTAPFNEYYILSYLAMVHEEDTSGRAHTFFDECFGTSDKPVGRNGQPKTTSYNGNEMLSDGNWLINSFTLQFPWFATKV